jgi:outer membrane protein OmpA-like peptidoglycan-associated protein
VQSNFTGMPMPLISSYMVQFAGYKVEKGKMSLGLNYKVANKQLTASNSILIDQLELGEKVENPNAVSLPLELAVALMKDSDGKIKIDVPISGSLEDPQFSVSHIVVDALVNTISKVISSPFRALASLIGSEEDLSTISFTAGEATLDKLQISKLDDLAKALKARPVLKLDIKGAAFQEPDWPAVSDDALYDQLKRLKAAEVNKQGGKKIRAEYAVVSDQDYRRLMEQLFAEKFPLMVEKSLLGTLRLVGSQADTNTDKFYAVAKEKLSAIVKPEPQRLKDLATQRAQAIANYIVQKGGIANEQVFILDTVIDPKRESAEIVSVLSLRVD